MFRDLVNSCWFALKWGFLAALLAAVGVGLYYYSRLNDEIRRRVEAKFAAAYPNLKVSLRSAQLIDNQGIEARGLSISDPRISGPPAELAYFDEMLLCCKTSVAELVQHEPKITRIVVHRPRLQATRLSDGSWSVSRLLPLPKFSQNKAEMVIDGAQVVIFDPQRDPPATYTLHDINLTVKPQTAGIASDDAIYDVVGSLAADHVQRIEVAGKLSRNGLDLNGSVRGIDVSPELLAALPPDQSERLAPLAPLRGQVALGFHVWRDTAQEQPWRFEVAGDLQSGRFDDSRLPQALADLHAKFHADNQGFEITDLTSKNGATELCWSARVDGYRPDSPMVIEGKATHLWIGPHWEGILPPKLLGQWRKFQPDGEINVNHAQAIFDGQRWRLTASVECSSVSFSYDRFPYRLEHGQGWLNLAYDPQVQQNRLTIDMAAYAGRQPLKIDGQFLNPGPEFTGGVKISGQDMPFDQNLYGAIAKTQPTASRVIQTLHLGGGFDFAVTCTRQDPHAEHMDQHLVVNFNRCTVQYEKFPYPLYNVTGDLQMDNGQWIFRNLEGTNNNSHVTCQGNLMKLDSGIALSLDFQGHDIVLEESLRDALPPRIRQLWNELRPKGSINLVNAAVNFTSATDQKDQKFDVNATIKPVEETVSIHPTFLPYRLERLKGAINFSLADGVARLEHLRGWHDRTEVSASGYCEHHPEGDWHLHFEDFNAAPIHFESDRELTIALPARLRKAVDQLRPNGQLSLSTTERGTLDFWGVSPPLLADGQPAAVAGDCQVRTAWKDLEVIIENGTLHPGVEVANISGGGVFSGSYDPLQGKGPKLQCRGLIDIDSAKWNGFQFTDISGPLYLDDQQVLLGRRADVPPPGVSPRKITAKSFGGITQADAWVWLTDTPSFSLQAMVDNVDLSTFCTEGPLPGRQNMKGKVSAGIDLSGTGAGVHSLAGKGEVKLSEADVYQLPFMVSLLKVLNLKAPSANAFSTSDFKFRIAGDHVLFGQGDIEFAGDAISLTGEGEMNLNTEINLKLQPIPGRADLQLPAWKRFAGGVSEQFSQIRVTGTLARPDIKKEPLPVINKAFQTLQSGMQPQDRSPQAAGMRPYAAGGEAPLR